MKQIIFVTVLMGLVIVFLSVPAMSQNGKVIVGSKNGESMITGTIEKISFDTMTLRIDDQRDIRVDLDDIDLDDNEFETFFKKGMTVKVLGKFDDDEFEARNVIQTNGTTDTNVTVIPHLD